MRNGLDLQLFIQAADGGGAAATGGEAHEGGTYGGWGDGLLNPIIYTCFLGAATRCRLAQSAIGLRSCELKSKLLKGGNIWDYTGEFLQGY